MVISEVRSIISEAAYPDEPGEQEIMETHISWVILTKKFAFKIKKPLKFNFLDFSDVEKRKFYCHREVELNRRLTKGIYLGVQPVKKENDRYKIGDNGGEVVDYAVQMKRLDNNKRMDVMLYKGKAGKEPVKILAKNLTEFHQHARRGNFRLELRDLQNDFSDILNVADFTEKSFGAEALKRLKTIVEDAGSIVEKLFPLMKRRKEEGFFLDGHGDLHSRNIFLYDEPVIFDCIEFNDSFRQLDVLNELAFLCMDLEYFEREDLANLFMRTYLGYFDCMRSQEERFLFQYFKMYRANIRYKVEALKALQGEGETEGIRKYFDLMARYHALLKKGFSEK